jgi:hypothetical protein
VGFLRARCVYFADRYSKIQNADNAFIIKTAMKGIDIMSMIVVINYSCNTPDQISF